ncbi:MAG TPA: HAMP domain-containing sensor histidine kinase, partial [Pirellulales bacterium]
MSLEDRVLLLTPTTRDAENTQQVLGRSGVATFVCHSIEELLSEFERGAAAMLLAEEALPHGAPALAEVLQRQPPWSDFPVLLLTRRASSPSSLRAVEMLGNTVLLERPIRMQALVTAVQAALRARMRQYEVRQRAESLAETARRKDEFLAMLAHELRNPLAPVRNGLELLKLASHDRTLSEEIRAMMERQVQHMVRLVDDLLDVSRITRGKVELRLEEIELLDAASRAVEAISPLIEHRRHKLTVMQPGRSIRLLGDPTRVVQVIGNLLNNAAKYTDEGGKITL